jgi:hypothetical protein
MFYQVLAHPHASFTVLLELLVIMTFDCHSHLLSATIRSLLNERTKGWKRNLQLTLNQRLLESPLYLPTYQIFFAATAKHHFFRCLVFRKAQLRSATAVL